MKTYLKILEELDWPNIYLVSPQQFEHVEGESVRGLYGMCSDTAPIIVINKGIGAGEQPIKFGLRGKVLKNTIYHEIAHILWPWRKHWWIECFGEKMAKGGGQGIYSHQYGHSVDELPSREKLLKMAKRATKRFNRRKYVKRR